MIVRNKLLERVIKINFPNKSKEEYNQLRPLSLADAAFGA